MGKIKLGSRVIVTDPCYGIDTWCQGVLEDVKPGDYNCHIVEGVCGSWGNRVKEIAVTHCDSKFDISEIQIEQDFEVGVDSGNAGIFDYDFYKSTCDEFLNWFDKRGSDHFYNPGGQGLLASSGCGDGSYTCYTHIDKTTGQVDGIRVVFIDGTEDLLED